MEPRLSLSYSSQAPIYGGVAAGWSIDIPMISDDPTQTLLRRQAGNAPEKFVTSLSGGHHLVQVTEPFDLDGSVAAAYRANNDGAYLRYELMNGGGTTKYWNKNNP